jgi:60 kDa SS-A/Ro ribonucleoprotein
MANKSIFKGTKTSRALPPTNTVNEAGGTAYKLEDRAALAQLVSTGCFNNTFYVTAEDQVKKVLELANKVDTKFLAQVAVFAREQGYMKDAPALLCAVLTTRGDEGRRLLGKIFNKVIDNGKMLRNFVQIMRSGVVGRKSMGSAAKRLVRDWLNGRETENLFRNSVGNDPSMSDILKMVHPKPVDRKHEATFAYLLGKDKYANYLPQVVKEFELFKAGKLEFTPNVPFEMLTALTLSDSQWKGIAENMSWTQLRMNLNTLKRHNVFTDKRLVKLVADKLRDPALVGKAKVFPYQLLMAYTMTEDVPAEIREALQDALDASLSNIPEVDGVVAVFPDHSGSMDSPATGQRGTATSKVTCKMVAALVAAAYLRKNKGAIVLPFAEQVSTVKLNPRDSVMTNAQILSRLPSGGTNCSAPLAHLNRQGISPDLAIFVSDNESWIDSKGSTPTSQYYGWASNRNATETLKQWERIRERNKAAKLVCIDIQPNGTSQAPDRKDILNVGGFSDRVFDLVSLFQKDQLDAAHWVGVISNIEV